MFFSVCAKPLRSVRLVLGQFLMMDRFIQNFRGL
ncbi:hypothetical protein RISW2_06165 [Roseivivax isoporae LMG 25204]|uniref:Uncharacterized protein n=1 Tax=Roseivivax isoporae LMG 25204 TaxID=1449351 RepID=X7F702_9RHOB|nr:hypothetical protein RISW2_06165 [Roseivivax isoporae LMG 25204]